MATDGLWDTVSPELAARVLSTLRPGQCPATRLMRAALSTPIGSRMPEIEDLRLAATLLSLPPGIARYYRDDITVLVIELEN